MPPSSISCSAGAATARHMLRLPLRPATRSTVLTATKAPVPSPSTATRSITSVPYPSRSPQRPLHARPRQYLSAKLPPHHNRAYHSHDHPPPPGPFTPAEAALLSAAYKHVPAHGFTPDALALGARDTGLLDISASLLADGPFSLIRWHLYTQRTGLEGKAAGVLGETGSMLTVGERVEMLAWERLRGNIEAGVVGRWQEALAIMAQPSHVPTSVKELAQLADEILYLAGDASVDPSWYTKRASLSTIYAAAELFQTTDRSPEFRETRAFLRRRLDEAAEVGGAVRSAGQWLGFTASAAVNVLRSKGARI